MTAIIIFVSACYFYFGWLKGLDNAKKVWQENLLAQPFSIGAAFLGWLFFWSLIYLQRFVKQFSFNTAIWKKIKAIASKIFPEFIVGIIAWFVFMIFEIIEGPCEWMGNKLSKNFSSRI